MSAGTEKALVVLAHGFLGGRIQLVPIAGYLARRYDVLNFGYKSRQDNVQGHAKCLVDVVRTSLEKRKQTVHFVTHSFGGVVLHRAFSEGLAETLADGTEQCRCVMIAPPLRGACFARAFQREKIRGPDMIRGAIHSAARGILGGKAGLQLLMHDEEWFTREIGDIPESVKVLVVVGSGGRLNPLIDGESDGVVGIKESVLTREHFRMQVGMTHNLLLYSPAVMQGISSFLDGKDVGEMVSHE